MKSILVLCRAVRQRYRKASGSIWWASMSATVNELPIDLAIFTPSASKCCPCTQVLTTGSPVYPSLWAISSS